MTALSTCACIYLTLKSFDLYSIIIYIELGSLTKSQLLEKVKELQGIAYQLGLEEGWWV